MRNNIYYRSYCAPHISYLMVGNVNILKSYYLVADDHSAVSLLPMYPLFFVVSIRITSERRITRSDPSVFITVRTAD